MAARTGKIRQNEQMGFVDAALAGCGGTRTTAVLERLDAATPWARLVAPIRALPEYRRRGPGHPPWCPELMLKCLLLQKWFNLSDPGLEEALKDRISFRRFVGLSFTDKTPDETTFVRFRDRLRAADLHERIFEAVVAHLDEQGLLVREGTMVDATIIESPRGRKRDDGTTTRDVEASYTRKHGRSWHGYKAHVATDASGIVTEFRFSTAKDHDSRFIDELTADESVAVFADSAYSDRRRRERLRRNGVIDAIAYRRARGQEKLFDWQETWNRLVAKHRARVEHAFAMLKQQLGYRRTRYRGLKRNELDFALTISACNIKKSLSLRTA